MARTHPGISPAITEPETGGFLVTVSGEIDLSREDDPSLAFATDGRLFVDMSRVAFIDSTGYPLSCRGQEAVCES